MMKEKAAGLNLPVSHPSTLESSNPSRRAPTSDSKHLQNLEMPTRARAFLLHSTAIEALYRRALSQEAVRRARVRKNARSRRRLSRAVSTSPRRGSRPLGPWKASVHTRKRRRHAPPAPAWPSVLIARSSRRATEMCGRCGVCRRDALCPGRTWVSPRKRSGGCSLARTGGAYNSWAFLHLNVGWRSSARTVPWLSRSFSGRPLPASEGGGRKAWCCPNSYCHEVILRLQKYSWKGAIVIYYTIFIRHSSSELDYYYDHKMSKDNKRCFRLY